METIKSKISLTASSLRLYLSEIVTKAKCFVQSTCSYVNVKQCLNHNTTICVYYNKIKIKKVDYNKTYVCVCIFLQKKKIKEKLRICIQIPTLLFSILHITEIEALTDIECRIIYIE